MKKYMKIGQIYILITVLKRNQDYSKYWEKSCDKQARGYKTLFFFNAQLSIKFIMLINVKMPTSVGILTFISMVNTTSES